MPTIRTASARSARLGRPRKVRATSLTTLALALALTLAAVPALGLVASAATLTEDQKLLAPGGASGERFGDRTAIDGDTAIVAGAHDALDDKGAAYVFERGGSGWDYAQTLTAPGGGTAGDIFGISLAIQEDTAFVGANGVDTGRGAVYVFEKTSGTWTYQQTLTTPGGADTWESFGTSVVFDGERALIGAPGVDNGRGAAYFFVTDGSTWSHERTIVAPQGQPNDSFGGDVALDGDTALVGAYRTNGVRGAAHIFERDGSSWSHGQTLLPVGGAQFDEFGLRVALDVPTALIAAPDYGSGEGAVYSFARVGSSWQFMQLIQHADPEQDDNLGWPVEIEGGLALIGASGRDATDKGAAYVFEHDGSSWVERDKLVTSTRTDYDQFGFGAALSDDTAIVGADGYDSSKGAAFVFEGMLGDYIPVEIAGATRYETAIEASKKAFPHGAGTVVIATGENWPDALGGAALAGAHDAPILLTLSSVLPDAVVAEIDRLGAKDAFILGETGAVSPAVESALAGRLGASHVTRIGGATRYETAWLVAEATIDELSANYDGTAFLATGADFPDALGASPLAAAGPWPIFLASPYVATEIATEMKNMGVEEVIVLGGTAVVFHGYEDNLAFQLGEGNVTRLAGPTRYETAWEVASYGVEEAGLRWNGVALAGGPVQGRAGSVMLLTHTAFLTPSTGAALQDEARTIAKVRFLGGPGAITQTVRDDVAVILE